MFKNSKSNGNQHILITNIHPEKIVRTPGTPGIRFRLHIVNKYQSLTIALKTPIPGVTWHVDPLLNLMVTIKKTYLIWQFVTNSLEVSFTKFARDVFRNPIFDPLLQELSFSKSSSNEEL